MRQFILLGTLAFVLAIFVACGSDSGNSHSQIQQGTMQGDEPMQAKEMSMQTKSSKDWIRTEPIDLKTLDMNHDGYVFQDQMDWNVIADEEGKCPQCGMVLKKVTIDEAAKNLKDNGYRIE